MRQTARDKSSSSKLGGRGKLLLCPQPSLRASVSIEMDVYCKR